MVFGSSSVPDYKVKNVPHNSIHSSVSRDHIKPVKRSTKQDDPEIGRACALSQERGMTLESEH
jgi:hypothetical protein